VTEFSVNDFTIVPGGSLPISGTYHARGTEVPNGDGSATQAVTATYSCEEVAAAEGDAEDTADNAEEQAEDAEEKADDAEEKADEKEQELEDKVDEKEEELRDDG